MFCPEGAPNQTLCLAGYYCSIPLPQLPCPAGYYCPEGSQAPVECPVGHYCSQGIVSHEGSTWVIGAMKPVKCPLGHREYDGSSRKTFNSTCEPCPAGYYGNHSDRQICLECQAGVVCLQGATTTDPPSNVTEYELTVFRSYICPKGHYCPNGSAEPIPCPVGTYNPSEGRGNVESCLRCPTNYFNHLTGQAACFTCGSQAIQPEEGHDRCICPQSGQMFQPSDSRCVCAVRHQMVSDGKRECVRKLYDICREGASRNQDGTCLTIGEWEEYCSLKVCASPADYQGYDRDLGLCLCRVAALDSVCDQQCRQLQRNTLQILCKGGPELCITYRNGLKDEVPLNHIGRILNSRNVLEQSQCHPHHNFIQPVYLVETSENVTMHVTSPSHKDPEAHGSGVHQSFVNGTLFSGIFNPTICIHTGSIILFTVSSEYYPVYDSVNLYNTDSDFDWGAFRELEEELELPSTSSWLFTYRFNQPGVHVFQLSSNPSKKMYVRVMTVGGQCYEEGPFFPTTPRTFIRMGIHRTQDLPFKPDWLVISSLLAASTATVGIWAGLMVSS
ncbi:uncharacterized protein LOC127583597 [Pristis pectinata]|uniref:uncharacterized protein LOC127583597 n=1 Tax=Pristis pectinata TaxID=685728 RepID=UPI00223C9479|nr:uncharacterized protein LOC127583597 [Pristis pectinata]